MREHRDAAMQKVYATRGLAGEIAKRIGVSYQAVQQWKAVPPQYVLDVAPLLGMTPEQVRPDIFKPRKVKR